MIIVTDETIKRMLSNVLKYGVRTVLLVGISGGIIYLLNHGNEKVDYTQFKEQDESILSVLARIFKGIKDFDGSSIIYLGIIILFLTPFLRLILSLFSFILEKDKLYVIITVLVIFIICLSIYFGFGH